MGKRERRRRRAMKAELERRLDPIVEELGHVPKDVLATVAVDVWAAHHPDEEADSSVAALTTAYLGGAPCPETGRQCRELGFCCLLEDASSYALRDDVAPRGLPRPLSLERIGGRRLPVPWIAKGPQDLGHVEQARRQVAVEAKLCQVCGLELGELAVVCCRPGDAMVTDGAAIHPGACWAMAARLCPHLVDLERQGLLEVWEVPTRQLLPLPAGQPALDAGLPAGYASPSWWVDHGVDPEARRL